MTVEAQPPMTSQSREIKSALLGQALRNAKQKVTDGTGQMYDTKQGVVPDLAAITRAAAEHLKEAAALLAQARLTTKNVAPYINGAMTNASSATDILATQLNNDSADSAGQQILPLAIHWKAGIKQAEEQNGALKDNLGDLPEQVSHLSDSVGELQAIAGSLGKVSTDAVANGVDLMKTIHEYISNNGL